MTVERATVVFSKENLINKFGKESVKGQNTKFSEKVQNQKSLPDHHIWYKPAPWVSDERQDG